MNLLVVVFLYMVYKISLIIIEKSIWFLLRGLSAKKAWILCRPSESYHSIMFDWKDSLQIFCRTYYTYIFIPKYAKIAKCVVCPAKMSTISQIIASTAYKYELWKSLGYWNYEWHFYSVWALFYTMFSAFELVSFGEREGVRCTTYVLGSACSVKE